MNKGSYITSGNLVNVCQELPEPESELHLNSKSGSVNNMKKIKNI